MWEFIKKFGPDISELPITKIDAKVTKPWERFIKEDNKHLCGKDAIDLLSKMLVFDHTGRITAKEALEHSYFDIIKSNSNKL
jgi:casein kinase II subunit alpha